jgi:FtsH-binding integral membrane protein
MVASQKHPAHAGFATIAISLMAIGLSAGLKFLGLIERLDEWIAELVIKPGLSAPVHSLDPYVLWISTAILTASLTAVMLNISASWRRILVWVLSLIITLFWVPVLLIASHKPDIAVALVGLLWAGCCALIYTMNHEIPADLTDNNTTKTDAPR